jgi:hypothetical protein
MFSFYIKVLNKLRLNLNISLHYIIKRVLYLDFKYKAYINYLIIN